MVIFFIVASLIAKKIAAEIPNQHADRADGTSD